MPSTQLLWASGSAPTLTTIDVGALPVYNATVVVADSRVSAANTILVAMQTTAPGKDADEVSMDSFNLFATAGASQISFFIQGLEGYIADKFTLLYIVCF